MFVANATMSSLKVPAKLQILGHLCISRPRMLHASHQQTQILIHCREARPTPGEHVRVVQNKSSWKRPFRRPFAGLSRPHVFLSQPKRGFYHVFVMFQVLSRSFRRPFAMQCFPFALDLQNLPLLNFKTGNLDDSHVKIYTTEKSRPFFKPKKREAKRNRPCPCRFNPPQTSQKILSSSQPANQVMCVCVCRSRLVSLGEPNNGFRTKSEVCSNRQNKPASSPSLGEKILWMTLHGTSTAKRWNSGRCEMRDGSTRRAGVGLCS